jgi:hypothetical protein
MATKNQQQERMRRLEGDLEKIDAGTQGRRRRAPKEAPSEAPMSNDAMAAVFKRLREEKK